MNVTNAMSSDGRDRDGRPWWLGGSRRVMPWALVLLLALVNLTTLLSDRIHDAAFSGVASVAAMAGPAIAETVVAHSPTMAKRRAVDGAAQKFEAERVALHTKNRALQAETEGLKVAKAALAKEHDALRALMSKRAAAVRALATRTTTVLAARSAEAIATLPVRAAPYVGLAALVGFTSLELQADCELAQALAALNAEHGNDKVDAGPVCNAVGKVPSPQQVWSAAKTRAGTALEGLYAALEEAARKLGLTTNSK